MREVGLEARPSRWAGSVGPAGLPGSCGPPGPGTKGLLAVLGKAGAPA